MGYNVSSKSNVISPSRRFFFNFVVLFFVSLSCSSVEVELCDDFDTTTRLEEESGAKLDTSGTTSSVDSSSRVKATNFMMFNSVLPSLVSVVHKYENVIPNKKILVNDFHIFIYKACSGDEINPIFVINNM